MNRFIQLLEEKWDKGFWFGGQHREHICKIPSEPQETAFLTFPQNVPIDYYDPSFFNGLQPHLCKQIALQTVVLLPNIEDLFTKYADENLSNSVFQSKFANTVLAKYRLDDLEEINDSEKEWLENEDFKDIVSDDVESAMDINQQIIYKI